MGRRLVVEADGGSRGNPGPAGYGAVVRDADTASSFLAVRRSPLAPAASVLSGGLTAAGIVLVHLLPMWWGFVSDPYWDFGANALSWALVIAPLAVGIWVAVVGARSHQAPRLA